MSQKLGDRARRFWPSTLVLFASACAGEADTGSTSIAEEALGGEEEAAPDHATRRELEATDASLAAEGDVLLLSRYQLGAVVPELGQTVTLIAELVDGTSRSFRIEHDASGIRTAVDVEEPEGDVTDAAPAACRDPAFSRTGHRWTAPYRWAFRASSVTAGAARGIEQSLREAAGNVAGTRNDCGLGRANVPAERYLGRTNRPSNVLGTATAARCGPRDGHNVVDFGVLPAHFVAVACTWRTAATAIEGDVKLRHGTRWFSGNRVPAGCQSALGVESVGTHEFGHVYGLGHVSESGHGNLTMSTATRYCTVSDTTLGRGDVLGLRSIYGP